MRGLHADVVYSDDELWDYEYGSEMRLRHKPGPRQGKKVAAYCHVTLEDGQAFVVLPWPEIMRIRDGSQNWRSAIRYGKEKENPWSTHEDRMAAKTAVRALAQRGEMPLSIEFIEAMEQEEHVVDYRSFAMNPEAGPIIDAEPEPAEEEPQETDPAMIEEAPPPQTIEEPKARAKEPARRSAPEPEAAAGGDLLPSQTGPDAAEMKALGKDYDRVLADAMDAGRGMAIEGNKAAIENMKARAPDMHARLMAELAEFE